MPLRVKLVALMLMLVTLALLATGVAGTLALRRSLVDQVDDQLRQSAQPAVRDCLTGRPQRGVHGPPLAADYYMACVRRDGVVLYADIETMNGEQRLPAPPDLPDIAGATVGEPFETAATTGGQRWRVLVETTQPGRQTGRLVVVALSLDQVDSTVRRLVVAEVVIGGLVLVVLGLVAYLMVRSSLRPLVAVEHTAEAIAAGDLTRRVPESDPHTEVGGLSRALNVMLGQIETAFEERRASEEAARSSEEAARSSAEVARVSEARMRRFVADASHELRTPLTSIRGFAELYRQNTGDDNPQIGRIEHHAIRMGTLVDDLLLLARLDQQRPLESKPIDLLALATDALVDARVTAGDHRLRLRTAAGEDEDVEPAVVRGDETRLRQVLANLLSNALTHTPAGTQITVFVGTEGDDAILEVADDGPGMSAEEAARVFERFYRTDPSRTRAHGGSGLGLSIVDALVAAHGGRVTLSTAEGQGARFTVRLPLLKVRPATDVS